MQTIFQASNAVEAHMLKNMLEQENVPSFIEGEFLQGAVGELPAHNLVRLVVADTDFERAQKIINEWQQAQEINHEEIKKEINAKEFRQLPKFILIVFGIILGLIISLVFFRTPYDFNGIDYNKDDQLDEKWTYSPTGVPLLLEIDRNLDKKFDFITRYNQNGIPENSEFDENFDGVFETKATYEGGNISITKTDTDGDGFADFVTNFRFGVVASVEYINVYSGYPNKICSYDLGKIKMCKIDTDLDRVMDKQVHYDASGEIRIPNAQSDILRK
jgi:tetrahydromethanopterin S-methyltransferase subunit G